MRRWVVSVLLASLPVCVVAEDLARGTVIERVIAKGKGNQSYALYIPGSYAPEKQWPILYCLDPAARGLVPVELFAEAAEKTGFIVAGSNNSRNGPMEPIRDAIFWMVTDTHERLSIDDARIYAAGFSGGARVALGWGLNGKLAGVAVCGAGFGSRLPEKTPFTVFAAAGVNDFNHYEMYSMSRALEKRGVAHRFVEFDGGHRWMPPALAADALGFFAGRLPPQPAKESKDEDRQFEQYDSAMKKLERLEGSSRDDFLKSLRKRAAKPDDNGGRRVARRVLSGSFIVALETARPLMEKKQYREAARAWELAVAAQPDAPGGWYSLAVSLAGAGDTTRALDAIERAVKEGFRDRERLESEPLFAPLRTDPRYVAALSAIPK